MTTFNWQITSMSAYPKYQEETDVVFQVDWACTALDSNGLSARGYGTVPVTYTAGTPFTPYDQLTQDQVWAGSTQASTAQRSRPTFGP